MQSLHRTKEPKLDFLKKVRFRSTCGWPCPSTPACADAAEARHSRKGLSSCSFNNRILFAWLAGHSSGNGLPSVSTCSLGKWGWKLLLCQTPKQGGGGLRRHRPSLKFPGRITVLQILATALVLLPLSCLLTWIRRASCNEALLFITQLITFRGFSHPCNDLTQGLGILCKGSDCAILL